MKLTIRGRLTALYGVTFLLAGFTLLIINYALTYSHLPPWTVSLPGSAGATTSGVFVAEKKNGPITSIQKVVTYRSTVLHTLLIQSLITLSIMVAISGLLGWLLARRALRPMHAITATARRLSADNIGGARIAMHGPRDELKELADTFDDMLERLGAGFESQRRFVANASHELRTPLATQRTLVEVAMAAPDTAPDMRELGEQLLAMNERSERMIDSLLVLARSERGLARRLPVELDSLVRSAVRACQDEAVAAGVTLSIALDGPTVLGDRGLLDRLVTNLVQNAIRHNAAGGTAYIHTSDTLVVENTGPVIAADVAATLFEPFRRLDERVDLSHGVGLGLSIVQSVARAHGGNATASARPSGGLRVTVTFGARC